MRRTAIPVLVAAIAATVVAVAGPGDAATVERRAGADRYDTAARVSAAAFAPGVPAAFVATGESFADALAAGPAAKVVGGPVLLTRRDELPATTEAELRRLRPGRIVVLGGPQAVSELVRVRLMTLTIGGATRIAGADRYDTAAQLSAGFSPGVPAAYLVSGASFPDALATGAAGAARGGPVLLTPPAALHPSTLAELRRLRPAEVVVAGGPGAVSTAVEGAVRAEGFVVRRVAGDDRYATAAAVVADAFPGAQPATLLATGTSFADALAGGALGAPLLLTQPSCLPARVRTEVDRLASPTVVLLGGPLALGPGVASLAVCTPGPDLAAVRAQLTPVTALSAPLAMAVRPDDPALYVAEKGGRVRRVVSGTAAAAPVLDLSGQVSAGSEQGLLGLAFSPDGTKLYVNYTDTAGDTQVVEYAMAGAAASTGTRRVVLTVDQPFPNHNGGHLAFGPDGMLYVGLGDGGSGNDPQDNGQRLDTLLGKILRIDPRPSGATGYTVPPGNPFVGRSGARPEIWTYGLRNPWRFSFDAATGDLWIGDVGQNRREEVDLLAAGRQAGANLGWARLEGTLPVRGTAPADAVAPVHEYPTEGGNCAVTGGYVYRGTRIAALPGAYVFGDYCAGRVLAMTPSGAVRDLGLDAGSIASFGVDHGGELYVLSLAGEVYRLDPQ